MHIRRSERRFCADGERRASTLLEIAIEQTPGDLLGAARPIARAHQQNIGFHSSHGKSAAAVVQNRRPSQLRTRKRGRRWRGVFRSTGWSMQVTAERKLFSAQTVTESSLHDPYG